MSVSITLWLLLSSVLVFGQYGNGELDSRVYYDISEALQTPKAVTKLYLDHHNLKSLSPNIVKFQNLRELKLGGNDQMDWDAAFELLVQLPQLEKLSLSENRIRKIPNPYNN